MIADLQEKIDAVIVRYRESTADGKWELSEVVRMVGDLLTLWMSAAQLVNATGAEKKALVMTLAEELYDRVIVTINIPYVIGDAAIYSMLRPAYLSIASGLIELLLPQVKANTLNRE